MYYLEGPNKIIQNIINLSRPFFKGVSDFSNLQRAFRDFLQKIQPNLPLSQVQYIQLLSKLKEVAPYYEAFTSSSLNVEVDFSIEMERTKAALQKIKEMDEVCFDLLNLVLHTIYFAPHDHLRGGSTMRALGTLWINPRPSWSDEDVLEIIIHESSHNYYFLDELANSHYVNYQEMLKFKIWSPIKHELRPLHKTAHAILVNMEIMLLREHYLGHNKAGILHGESKKIKENTAKSLDEIFKSEEALSYLNERMKHLLTLCEKQLQVIRA